MLNLILHTDEMLGFLKKFRRKADTLCLYLMKSESFEPRGIRTMVEFPMLLPGGIRLGVIFSHLLNGTAAKKTVVFQMQTLIEAVDAAGENTPLLLDQVDDTTGTWTLGHTFSGAHAVDYTLSEVHTSHSLDRLRANLHKEEAEYHKPPEGCEDLCFGYYVYPKHKNIRVVTTAANCEIILGYENKPWLQDMLGTIIKQLASRSHKDKEIAAQQETPSEAPSNNNDATKGPESPMPKLPAPPSAPVTPPVVPAASGSTVKPPVIPPAAPPAPSSSPKAADPNPPPGLAPEIPVPGSGASLENEETNSVEEQPDDSLILNVTENTLPETINRVRGSGRSATRKKLLEYVEILRDHGFVIHWQSPVPVQPAAGDESDATPETPPAPTLEGSILELLEMNAGMLAMLQQVQSLAAETVGEEQISALVKERLQRMLAEV